jgi:hypothetical protein
VRVLNDGVGKHCNKDDLISSEMKMKIELI